MSQYYDSNGVDHPSAVAAAAYAISSLNDFTTGTSTSEPDFPTSVKPRGRVQQGLEQGKHKQISGKKLR